MHPLRLSGLGVGRLDRGVELGGVAALLARAVAAALAATKRHVVVHPGGGQVHHHHARLGVALEVRGVLEAGGGNAAGQAKGGVVGQGQGFVQCIEFVAINFALVSLLALSELCHIRGPPR